MGGGAVGKVFILWVANPSWASSGRTPGKANLVPQQGSTTVVTSIHVDQSSEEAKRSATRQKSKSKALPPAHQRNLFDSVWIEGLSFEKRNLPANGPRGFDFKLATRMREVHYEIALQYSLRVSRPKATAALRDGDDDCDGSFDFAAFRATTEQSIFSKIRDGSSARRNRRPQP